MSSILAARCHRPLDKVFDVKIASTGAIFKIPGDKTVTGFLEEKGVKIPTSCEQGMCGTCKIKSWRVKRTIATSA